jgi:hypothetical protein
MTAKRKTDAAKFSPYLMMSIIAGVALMVGVLLGNSGSTGPAPSQASVVQQQPHRTPGSEAEEKNENTDSLVVSDNSGTVNVGGTHYHGTPGSEIQERHTTVVVREIPVTRIVERVVEKPVYIERVVEKPVYIERTVTVTERPAKIWTRPSVPAESRLGRTMMILKKFDSAGVRLYAEN